MNLHIRPFLMSQLLLLFDRFTICLIAVITVATVAPARGQAGDVAEGMTALAVALLFFLHGAKLSRSAIAAGALHWRLHLLVFVCTFVMFPILGILLQPVLEPLLGPSLYLGVLYLCMLPGTVQSAIAFTSVARGNVPAAVCSASASSIIGTVLTPLLLNVFLQNTMVATASILDTIAKICVQLLLPFIAGQLLRPWIGRWVDKNKSQLAHVDQGSILLVVYTAFSASIVDGLWNAIPLRSLLVLAIVCTALLFFVLWMTTQLARTLRFEKEDEITIVFCGSKKSMATGIPMAHLIFSSAAVGPVLLPLMIFHQFQLMACSVLAQHYAKRIEEYAPTASS